MPRENFYPYGYDTPIGFDDAPSELSHGRGLTPKQKRLAAPDDGGMYAGKTPPIAPDRRGQQRYGYPGTLLRT
jgi:hypothetical protein